MFQRNKVAGIDAVLGTGRLPFEASKAANGDEEKALLDIIHEYEDYKCSPAPILPVRATTHIALGVGVG